ncbi:MAG TPA: carboxypeptidase-like regulatory domain-containing protein [Candidatus Sulfotelmatobacter sp.]|nr:carboxypeptidase-like regulatory domain-containing protein [Candidatus Sulfotelmatobacter sp.]
MGRSLLRAGLVGCAVAGAVLAGGDALAQPRAGAGPAPPPDAIAGTVTGPDGPEAGVWVIAETIAFQTKFARIVVTDAQGRYLVPALPRASYTVWVRGYGLVDSPKVHTEIGKRLDFAAVPAPNPAAAAAYYPAIYWYAMLKIPPPSAFGPGGLAGSQERWLDVVKTDGCYTCHQLGDLATRTVPKSLGHFASSADAWERRIQSGQAGTQMVNAIGRIDTHRALELFGDWTDRIAAGELPFARPPRPEGVERNVVITLWDWANAHDYLHDEISTDRRNPTVNAYGPIYGTTEESTEYLPVLDPLHNTKRQLTMPVRDPHTPSSRDLPQLAASPYWGEEAIWDARTSVHNAMFDERGRLWFTTRIRPATNPAFCRSDSNLESAKLFPLDRSGRQLALFEPKNNRVTLIDTCFTTHHLQFGYDANDTLWTSAGGPGSGAVGWFNTRLFDETGDAEKAQGWTALILDTNGNGRRDDYVEPDAPVDPTKDKRVAAAFYGVAPSPVDGSVWGSSIGFPGAVVRLTPGDDPPATALAELYEPPLDDPKAPIHGYSPRGMDIDGKGVVWTSLASGQLASFDRRKCEGPLNGPRATGKQCPEGWTLYPFPGPQFRDVHEPGSAEASYYTWVDQHDTFGLGRDVPIATGNANDALLALVGGKWVILRVPYPMGFYAKGLDGRIDDPNAGWKGRGLWSTYATRTPFHMEGGKGTTSKVVHFQLRPNPLAD